MSFEFNLPNFQVETPAERRMYAYLHQMVQQLNWAMKHIETAESTPGGTISVRQVSPETGQLREAKTPLETFAELKGLIIKSADIANSYCETIQKRLDGLYVAQSEFGEYVEATKLELEANAKGVTQNYTNLQSVQINLDSAVNNIQTDVGGLRQNVAGLGGDVQTLQGKLQNAQDGLRLTEEAINGVQGRMEEMNAQMGSVQTEIGGVRRDVSDAAESLEQVRGEMAELRGSVGEVNAILVKTNAYIRTGLIDTDGDGVPVYGLEIGQTNQVGGQEIFNKYARFSSSRLSFYDQNDTEVAYISDYKLYITNVHITGKLTVGHYEIDTSDGLAFLWIGGGIS